MGGPPPPPPGFLIDGAQSARPQESAPPPPPGFQLDGPTGQVHDGDTFRLTSGRNARLYGIDAFELDQLGHFRSGTRPIGILARDRLGTMAKPGASVFPTGGVTYGRPVVRLDNGGTDAGQVLLREGWGVAAPEYLSRDPKLLGNYMEAERLARLNRLGAHAGRFQIPKDYRAGKPDPWAAPQPGKEGESTAVFWDEPTPFQGLRKDVADGYLAVASDPNSTEADILAYADRNGFQVNPKQVQAFVEERKKAGGQVNQRVDYQNLPPLLTDPGDGALGAGLRGFADPINMLDEMGGVVDTLGGTPGRESLWNSDRRFGDILYNNIDQNRAILGFDDANHPYARFGGQLASGVVLPGATVEGVGLNAARAALRGGASRYAAVNAAKAAVRRRLATAGTAEGALAGFGSGENWQERGTGAVIGGATGAGLGYLTAAAGQELAPRVLQMLGRGARKAEPAPPPEGYVLDAPERDAQRVIGQAVENGSDVLSSPRVVDRIDVNAGPRRLLDPASDMERIGQASNVRPSDMLPLPGNAVGSMEEAASIGAGQYRPVKAIDEASTLAPRRLPSPVDASRSIPKRGPLDVVTFIRSRGGLVDEGGNLSHLGLTNAGRDMDFARGEQRFGKLIDNHNGMTLDDAANMAWEAGFFPDLPERPTIREFLDALDHTYRGTNRTFRPDDYPEIDAFNAARAQRHAVEKAQFDGAPLVEDRGQPVTLADLENNAPPVSAYEEWPDGGPDFAGNIRLGNLDSPQNIKRALAASHARVGGFDAATRGRVTQAETERLASELGMTPKQLLSRRQGQAFNAEEALAARQILAKSGNGLVNLARRVHRMDDPGEEALAEFRRAWVRHVAIQEQVAGMTAEAGRTLQQFRMMADATNVRGNVLAALSESGGGRDALKKAADLILEGSSDPANLNANARNALKPKFSDKINELWINSLLSGPQTHIVNMMSNTMTSLAQIPEHAAAASIGLVRSMVKRPEVVDRVLFSEIGARSVGLLQGTKEGLRQFVRTLRTGQASDFANKVEARNQEAISGVKGKIIRTPTRLLSAEDELFKGMARRMELSGLAVRKARAEGLKGQAARQRAAELLANPTDDMLEKALDYGRYLTFQRPLGDAARHVSMFAQNMPGMKFVLPFVRTPTNLLKFSLERSPAAPLVDTWRKDFMAGGARRDLALARAMVGTGVGALVAEMASNGLITADGPADEGAKELLRADGWQPYSIRVGDKYVSYQRLDPFASTLGVAAGMVELQDYMTEKQKDRVALLVSASVMQNLASKTWLSGIGSLVGAINDPARYADDWWQRLVASAAVPAGVAQVARTVDPTLREAESILDAVRQRIPVMSKRLPARRDVWGRPVMSEGSAGPDIISPIWTTTRKNDPINSELLRLGINVGQPKRDVGGVRLDAEQWGRYRALSGDLSRSSLSSIIATPDWQRLSIEQKRDGITEALSDSRKQAKGLLFSPSTPLPPAGFRIDPPPAGYVMDR